MVTLVIQNASKGNIFYQVHLSSVKLVSINGIKLKLIMTTFCLSCLPVYQHMTGNDQLDRRELSLTITALQLCDEYFSTGKTNNQNICIYRLRLAKMIHCP